MCDLQRLLYAHAFRQPKPPTILVLDYKAAPEVLHVKAFLPGFHLNILIKGTVPARTGVKVSAPRSRTWASAQRT